MVSKYECIEDHVGPCPVGEEEGHFFFGDPEGHLVPADKLECMYCEKQIPRGLWHNRQLTAFD